MTPNPQQRQPPTATTNSLGQRPDSNVCPPPSNDKCPAAAPPTAMSARTRQPPRVRIPPSLPPPLPSSLPPPLIFSLLSSPSFPPSLPPCPYPSPFFLPPPILHASPPPSSSSLPSFLPPFFLSACSFLPPLFLPPPPFLSPSFLPLLHSFLPAPPSSLPPSSNIENSHNIFVLL